MELRFGLISVDDHVQEHPEVWTSRMSQSRWGDRVPHVETLEDGTERWVVDGKPLELLGLASVGALLPDSVREPQRWEDVPTAAYVPGERLKAMDVDNVDCSVLYPTVAGLAGETFGKIQDPELELACVRAYNDWLLEEWAAASPRFIPQCIVPLSSLEAAAQEIRRAVSRGHRGVAFPAVPMHLREDLPHINEPDYDVIWDTCQELGVPLCLHAGSSPRIQFPAYEGLSPAQGSALYNITRPISSVPVVANFLYSRILMRFPGLKVVFAETTLTWATYILELADHQFERQRLIQEKYTMTPSEMFRQSCYFTGWYDRTGVRTRHAIGTDNILWGTSFPLATSSWPESSQYIERCFQDVPDEERDRMLAGNAAALYKL